MIEIIIGNIIAWMFGGASVTARRIVAAVFAIVFGAYTLLVLITQLRSRFNLFGGIFGSFTATAAILCGWFALRGHLPQSRLHVGLTMRGGLIVGGIGFVAGFFGPVIFQPKANQGPLLGIFVTGPLGFVLGAVIGWFYGRFRHEARIKPA